MVHRVRSSVLAYPDLLIPFLTLQSHTYRTDLGVLLSYPDQFSGVVHLLVTGLNFVKVESARMLVAISVARKAVSTAGSDSGGAS